MIKVCATFPRLKIDQSLCNFRRFKERLILLVFKAKKYIPQHPQQPFYAHNLSVCVHIRKESSFRPSQDSRCFTSDLTFPIKCWNGKFCLVALGWHHSWHLVKSSPPNSSFNFSTLFPTSSFKLSTSRFAYLKSKSPQRNKYFLLNLVIAIIFP